MTYQQTLVEFLEARLAEDWEVARAAITPVGDTWEATGGVEVVGDTKGRQVGEWTVCFNEGSPNEEQAEHIARFDPSRVLREVAAKRAILAEHGVSRYQTLDGTVEPPECRRCGGGAMLAFGACTTIRYLAAVYSDHENYRDEWRP